MVGLKNGSMYMILLWSPSFRAIAMQGYLAETAKTYKRQLMLGIRRPAFGEGNTLNQLAS